MKSEGSVGGAVGSIPSSALLRASFQELRQRHVLLSGRISVCVCIDCLSVLSPFDQAVGLLPPAGCCSDRASSISAGGTPRLREREARQRRGR